MLADLGRPLDTGISPDSLKHALLAAVVRKPETDINSALDRLLNAGLLFRQGVPPHASYLFKHALVQDAAYGTLLREPRRALHARIAETIENSFSLLNPTTSAARRLRVSGSPPWQSLHHTPD